MQITVPRGELKAAVTGFNKIVYGKSHTLPILGGIRFVAGDPGVTGEATDLDQFARYTFAHAQVTGTGAFILPLANMKELAKGNDKEHIEFDVDGANITVTNHVGDHAVRHPLNGMDVEEWPSIPVDVRTKPAAGFLDVYRRLVPFSSNDATRHMLQSVYVDVAEHGDHPVTMVATDGRRLTCWNSMNLPVARGAVVPVTKFLQWNALQGDVELGCGTAGKKDSPVWFALRIGAWAYLTRTIDGSYPNWRQVIPSVPDAGVNRITFTEDDVLVLRRILPTFPGHESRNEALGLGAAPDGKVVITGRGDGDKDDTRLVLTGGSRCEGKTCIGVSRVYLMDALDAGFRVFTYTDSFSPLRSDDGRGGIHVLMPLRLGNESASAVQPTAAASDGINAKPEPEAVPGAGTAADTNNTKGATKTMPKDEANGTGTAEQGTALDKVLTAVDTAKTKIREAATALADVADAVKTAAKEGKAQAADLEKARVTLQKLQAISL